MTAPILQVSGISKSFGGLQAVSDLSFELCERQILGLIGPNGAGKTTCFNLLTGFLTPDSGTVKLRGTELQTLRPPEIARAGIVRTFQHTTVFPSLTVEENLIFGGYLTDKRTALGAFFNTRGYREAATALKSKAQSILALLGMLPRRFDRAGDLSYGELRYLEIALALMASPQVLLLDEPAAGLNIDESRRLRGLLLRLQDEGYSIVLVEHNMNLVMSCCDNLVVISFGQKIAEGTPEEIRHNPRVVEVYLGGSTASFAKAR